MDDYRHVDHMAPQPTHGDGLEFIRQCQAKAIDYAVATISQHPNAIDLLDVGASEGFLADVLPWRSYVGVDPAPRAPHVLCGEACDTDIRRDGYDLVVYNHVLEHTVAPLQELFYARERQLDGQHLFIAVPDATAPWAWEYDGHLWLFNRHTLTRLLTTASYEVVAWENRCFRRDCVELWVVAQARAL